MKEKTRNITIGLVALVVLAVLLWLPFTRAIIVFILPLGNGLDDLLMFAALIGAAVFALFKVWGGKNE